MCPAFSFRRRCIRNKNSITEKRTTLRTPKTIKNVIWGNMARSPSIDVENGSKLNGDSRCSYVIVKLSSTGLVLKVTSEIMIHLFAYCRSNLTNIPIRWCRWMTTSRECSNVSDMYSNSSGRLDQLSPSKLNHTLAPAKTYKQKTLIIIQPNYIRWKLTWTSLLYRLWQWKIAELKLTNVSNLKIKLNSGLVGSILQPIHSYP